MMRGPCFKGACDRNRNDSRAGLQGDSRHSILEGPKLPIRAAGTFWKNHDDLAIMQNPKRLGNG